MSRLPIPHFIQRLFAEKADKPVIVTVTVDATGPSMSAADQAKLTSDMVMCWWYNPDKATKLNSSLNMIPGDGSISWGTNAATASSSTNFTIAFIHSANGGSIASVIQADLIKVVEIDSSFTVAANGTLGDYRVPYTIPVGYRLLAVTYSVTSPEMFCINTNMYANEHIAYGIRSFYNSELTRTLRTRIYFIRN